MGKALFLNKIQRTVIALTAVVIISVQLIIINDYDGLEDGIGWVLSFLISAALLVVVFKKQKEQNISKQLFLNLNKLQRAVLFIAALIIVVVQMIILDDRSGYDWGYGWIFSFLAGCVLFVIASSGANSNTKKAANGTGSSTISHSGPYRTNESYITSFVRN